MHKSLVFQDVGRIYATIMMLIRKKQCVLISQSSSSEYRRRFLCTRSISSDVLIFSSQYSNKTITKKHINVQNNTKSKLLSSSTKSP